jgi:hypothetical protein
MVDPLRLAPEHLVITPIIPELGWDPVRVPILPLPHQIAEKVHAMTRTLRDGTPRTRVVKDLADLVLLSMIERPVAAEVRMALDAVFRAYNTHSLPGAIPTTPIVFEREFRLAAEDLGMTADLAEADKLVGQFLNPVLQGPARGIWDPTRRCWVDVHSS